MATYTFETTLEQEALLTWIVQQGNRQKDTTYTNAEYVALRFPELLAPYAEAYRRQLSASLIEQFEKADPSLKGRVIQLLGVA